MSDEKAVNPLIEELRKTINDGQRFAKTFIAYTKNELTDEEFIEQCSDIFPADKNIQKEARNFLRQIIEHLFLLKYQIDVSPWDDFEYELIKNQMDLIIYLDWDLETQETLIINNLEEEMPQIYAAGIRTYTNSDKKNPNLKVILESIPEQCPWTLDELVEGEPEDLILRLPEL